MNKGISATGFSYQEALENSTKYFNGDELAARVIVDKYLLRNQSNLLSENGPEMMFARMASELARVEKQKFKTPLSYNEIYNYLKDFKKIILQGSIMFGLGNSAQIATLSNCYVLETPVDSYGGICKTDEQLVQISKRRGGTGLDLSHIRPSNVTVNNSARTSTGIIPFMRRFSNSIREVGQGGRRGALMMTLSVHHPQILDFCSVKKDKNEITGANISVRLTDEFLNAVDKDLEYEQRWPVDSKTPKISIKVKAKDVWKEIIKNAHNMAEPGLLFWDTIIRESPADCYASEGFRSESTNPCCLAKDVDVKVVTDNGIKEIKNIINSDLIWIDHKQAWKKCSGYFDAGVADVFKVTFSNNEELYITKNHKLAKSKFKRNGTKIIYDGFDLTELKNLSVGDKISIHTNEVLGYKHGEKGTYEEGLIMGWLTGDGCLSYHDDKSNYPDCILDFWSGEYDVADKIYSLFKKLGYELVLGSNGCNDVRRIRTHAFTRDFTNKYETNIWKFKSSDLELPFLEESTIDFFKGFISSYFSADGTVEVNHESKGYSISLASINKARLIQIKNIFLYFGIRSTVCLLRKSGESEFKNGGKYQTKDCWRLIISGEKYIKRFFDNFGFLSERKNEQLQEILSVKREKESKCQDYITIRNIELIGEKPVGCIEVEDEHSLTVNGIISGQSELPLSVLDSCRLGLINLFSYVKNPFTAEAKFDYDEFSNDSKVLQRVMDDIVDLELEHIDRIIKKIQNDQETEDVKARELQLWQNVRKACFNGRRTGSGITALGDTLAALNVSYGSKESIKIAGKIYQTLKMGCYESSVEIAKELGAFPVWNHEKEKGNPFLLRLKDENESLWKKMKEYGRRNIAILTTAPAGSVSILTQTSSGIEPVFQLSYTRRKKITHEDKNARIDFTDETGDKWQEFTVYHPKVDLWKTTTGVSDIKKSPWFGCCAEDLSWADRVKLQSEIQKHIDHSISSTLNLPEDVSVNKVAEIYETAWKSGCKGITIYRKNCRTGVLVDIKEDKKDISFKRPKELLCDVHYVTANKEQYYVIVGKRNGPYEVFTGLNHHRNKEVVPQHIKVAKLVKEDKGKYVLQHNDHSVLLTNGHNDYNCDALSRLVSTSLRHLVPLQFICEQLLKTEGDMFIFSKVIARVLKKYIGEGTKSADECPECKTSLIYKDGCCQCVQCGYSKCS